MNTPTKRVFITVQGGSAYNAEDKSDPEVTVLILDFDNDPECAICEAQIGENDEWAFSDAHNDFVHADCLHGKPMTDAEYIAAKGNQCPFCRSLKVMALDDGNFDGTGCAVEVHCDGCNKSYFDHYELTGYHIF